MESAGPQSLKKQKLALSVKIRLISVISGKVLGVRRNEHALGCHPIGRSRAIRYSSFLKPLLFLYIPGTSFIN